MRTIVSISFRETKIAIKIEKNAKKIVLRTIETIIKKNRRKNNRERKRKNRNKRRKNRKNNTSIIDSNIDFLEREKKQKKHNERQIKKTCYKCEFTNHFIEICLK